MPRGVRAAGRRLGQPKLAHNLRLAAQIRRLGQRSLQINRGGVRDTRLDRRPRRPPECFNHPLIAAGGRSQQLRGRRLRRAPDPPAAAPPTQCRSPRSADGYSRTAPPCRIGCRKLTRSSADTRTSIVRELGRRPSRGRRIELSQRSRRPQLGPVPDQRDRLRERERFRGESLDPSPDIPGDPIRGRAPRPDLPDPHAARGPRP